MNILNWKALIAAGLGLGSVVLTTVGTIGCKTFEINLLDQEFTNSNGQNTAAEFDIQFSPYLFRTTGSANQKYNTGCLPVPGLFELDRKWKSAMVVPAASWFIAIINVIALLCSVCCSCGRSTFPFIGFMFAFVNTTMNAMVFLVFRSRTCETITTFLSAVEGAKASGDLSCDVGPGFPYMVAGICGYFVTGLVCLCPFPSSPKSAAGDDDERHAVPSPKPSADVDEQPHAENDA